MHYSKPMKHIRREMYQRKHATRVNLKQAAKEYAKGIAIILFFVVLILGWSIALTQPTCTHDYKTNITTC